MFIIKLLADFIYKLLPKFDENRARALYAGTGTFLGLRVRGNFSDTFYLLADFIYKASDTALQTAGKVS
jgi:hypothetical protein